LAAETRCPLWVTVAFHELATVSAASASWKPAVHPVSGAVPLFVTVSCDWDPPDQELTTLEVSAHEPLPGVGEPDGGGDGLVDVV
jgi:hypothetical protein